jgi:hypothetical protein
LLPTRWGKSQRHLGVNRLKVRVSWWYWHRYVVASAISQRDYWQKVHYFESLGRSTQWYWSCYVCGGGTSFFIFGSP